MNTEKPDEANLKNQIVGKENPVNEYAPKWLFEAITIDDFRKTIEYISHEIKGKNK